jgi:hypothetical protein
LQSADEKQQIKDSAQQTKNESFISTTNIGNSSLLSGRKSEKSQSKGIFSNTAPNILAFNFLKTAKATQRVKSKPLKMCLKTIGGGLVHQIQAFDHKKSNSFFLSFLSGLIEVALALSKECVIFGLTSTIFQNLEEKIMGDMEKARIYLQKDKAELFYSSRTKQQSFEDTLHFFPALFKLHKSCLISLPSFEQYSLALDKSTPEVEEGQSQEDYDAQSESDDLFDAIQKLKIQENFQDFQLLNEYKIKVQS